MTRKFTDGTTLEAYVYRMVESEGKDSEEFRSLEKSLGVEKMRAEGLTCEIISTRLGTSNATVHQLCKREGWRKRHGCDKGRSAGEVQCVARQG